MGSKVHTKAMRVQKWNFLIMKSYKVVRVKTCQDQSLKILTKQLLFPLNVIEIMKWTFLILLYIAIWTSMIETAIVVFTTTSIKVFRTDLSYVLLSTNQFYKRCVAKFWFWVAIEVCIKKRRIHVKIMYSTTLQFLVIKIGIWTTFLIGI
jgi:hypothetical protein